MIAVFLRIALAIASAIAASQQAAHGQADDVLVRVETTLGTIDIAIDAKHAPITAANFLKYADSQNSIGAPWK